MAALAEESKIAKYRTLHMFVPPAVETTGVFGPLTHVFLKDIGRRIFLATGERLSRYHLTQCVSVTIQRGNAASVMGTSGYFYLLCSMFVLFVLSVFCFNYFKLFLIRNYIV